MGSWSVYCGISQIAITSGKECVLLPLMENKYMEYDEYIPATLPIYGEYDDYGGIEKIEKNENTQLIEEHFNCTIEQFCHYFTRGCISTSESDFPKFLMENEEIQKWKFMFIDREVYDFMSTFVGNDEKGNFDFGKKELLELLGFTFNGKVDKNRWDQEWEIKGKKFYSDGYSLHSENGHPIFTLNGGYSQLSQYIELDENILQYANLSKTQLWKYMGEEDSKSSLLNIFGYRYDGLSKYLINILKEKSKLTGIPFVQPECKTIREKYIRDYLNFGDELCKLTNTRYNLHPMSSCYKPYVLYLTPQCGDFENHQILLDKFAEINKKNIEGYG